MHPVRVFCRGEERSLAELRVPLELERLVPGSGAWQVEIGFGKGRFLLERAVGCGGSCRFLGIEMASRYYRRVRDRARKRGISNVILLRGEALYLLSAALPEGFAAGLHVYFPDPWPKSRHHKRRLFDPETIDLVVGLLRPRGRLFFATDHLEYGARVGEVLDSHPALSLSALEGPWEGGPRTNYEAKYLAEGRPIVRLEAVRRAGSGLLHPAGRAGILAATSPREREEPV